MIMHGAQSREGSGGESSGDEADLDRLEHEIVPFLWICMVIKRRKVGFWMRMTITINQDGYFLQGGSGKPLWLGSQFEEQSWIKKQLEGQHVQLEGQSFGLTDQSWLPLKFSQCSHSPGVIDFFLCFFQATT